MTPGRREKPRLWVMVEIIALTARPNGNMNLSDYAKPKERRNRINQLKHAYRNGDGRAIVTGLKNNVHGFFPP
jgi:hypothetical protein